MVSTLKKKQSNRRFLGQLGDFDQDLIIGNAASDGQENNVVSEGTSDRDFTTGTPNSNVAINESTSNMKTLERCFNEGIDGEMNNIVDTVEDRIQNAILTAVDNIIMPKIELAVRSVNASSGQDVTSMGANSERGKHVRLNTSFENASGNDKTLRASMSNDETRNNILHEVSDLPVQKPALTSAHTLITILNLEKYLIRFVR